MTFTFCSVIIRLIFVMEVLSWLVSSSSFSSFSLSFCMLSSHICSSLVVPCVAYLSRTERTMTAAGARNSGWCILSARRAHPRIWSWSRVNSLTREVKVVRRWASFSSLSSARSLVIFFSDSRSASWRPSGCRLSDASCSQSIGDRLRSYSRSTVRLRSNSQSVIDWDLTVDWC